jgi:hypothetical protein
MTQYRSLISTRRCIVAASAAVCNSNFNAISVRPTGTSRSTPSLRSRRERDGRGGAARGQPSSSHGRPVLNDPRPAYRSGRQQPRDPFRKERDRWFESISLQRRVSCEPDFLDQGADGAGRYFPILARDLIFAFFPQRGGPRVRIQLSALSAYQKTLGIPPFSASRQKGFVPGFVPEGRHKNPAARGVSPVKRGHRPKAGMMVMDELNADIARLKQSLAEAREQLNRSPQTNERTWERHPRS